MFRLPQMPWKNSSPARYSEQEGIGHDQWLRADPDDGVDAACVKSTVFRRDTENAGRVEGQNMVVVGIFFHFCSLWFSG